MKNFKKIFLIIFYIAFEMNSAILHSKPKDRKAFLTFNRSETWNRHIDRERFREELVRKM